MLIVNFYNRTIIGKYKNVISFKLLPSPFVLALTTITFQQVDGNRENYQFPQKTAKLAKLWDRLFDSELDAIMESFSPFNLRGAISTHNSTCFLLYPNHTNPFAFSSA